MNTFIKWFGIALAALLLLLAAVTALLYLAVDEQAIKAALAERVRRELDATLSIEGNLVIAVLPAPSVLVGDIELRAPAGSDSVLAAARSLQLRTALLPLLGGTLAIDELVIRGLRINAIRDAHGRGNWEILRREGTEPAGAPREDQQSAGPVRLAADRVRIEDGAIGYVDEGSGVRHELQQLQMAVDGLNLQGQPFRLEGAVQIARATQSIAVQLDSTAVIDASSGVVDLADVRIGITEPGGGKLGLQLPSLRLDSEHRVLEAGGLLLEAEGLAGTASARLDWSQPALSAAGSIDLKRLDYTRLAPVLGLAAPSRINPQLLADMALGGDFQLAGGTATLDQLRLRAGTLQASGSVRYTPGAPARIEARLDVPRLDLDQLLVGARNAAGGAAAPVATPSAEADTVPIEANLILAIDTLVRGPATLNGVRGSLDVSLVPGVPTSLDGPVRLDVSESQLRGVSAEEVICKAAATLNKEALTTHFEPLTRADSMTLELDFAEGVGTVRRLDAALPVMRLDGGGRIDLGARRLALQLQARITGEMEKLDPACRMTRKMQRVAWPVSCNGSLDTDPAKWCGVDKDDLAQIAAQLATESLGDKLKDKLGDFFRRN